MFLRSKFSTLKTRMRHGFTVIEVLVAITIILVGILAPLAFAARAISAGRVSKNRLIAAHLAQEGVELVRNIRDENIVSRDPAGAFNGIAPGGPYMIESGPGNIELDSHDGDELYLRPIGGCDCSSYKESGQPDEKTIFKREIKIIDASSRDGSPRQVGVEVTWKDFGVDKSIILVSYLYDWP